MQCRINFQSDPISLNILAANGYEHAKLDEIGDGGILEIGFDDTVLEFKIQRPECFEFAMEFLGSPEKEIIEKYIQSLEAIKVRVV